MIIINETFARRLCGKTRVHLGLRVSVNFNPPICVPWWASWRMSCERGYETELKPGVVSALRTSSGDVGDLRRSLVSAG